MEKKGWKQKSTEEINRIFAFSEGYKKFLDAGKTEREAAVQIEQALRTAGFTDDPGQPGITG